ncbi:MAG: hypothetical protein HS112_03725 [Zoogloeaceae bacterium]|nr:hypothetical protein [Zoogloeaceae bacterium]
MAGSIKDALGKANIKPEMFKKEQASSPSSKTRPGGKAGGSPEPQSNLSRNFTAEMAKQGVKRAQYDNNRSDQTSPGLNKSRKHSDKGLYGKSGKGSHESKAGGNSKLNDASVKKELAKELTKLAKAYSSKMASDVAEKAVVYERPYELRITGPVSPSAIFEAKKSSGFTIFKLNPHDKQLPQPEPATPDVELCIGLDFGTSCTKVVVGDKAMGKAYAIPFLDKEGIGAYLLPARIWEFNEIYSLQHGGVPYRDLKLRLLNEKYDEADFERAAAYLALAIRHVRRWILSQPQYKSKNIAWGLNLGLPAQSYADNDLVSRFRALAMAAEAIASGASNSPSKEAVREICLRIRKTFSDDASRHYAIETEIDVVPEISAQIYGFVQSEHFDPKGINVFMMVDIGAGTIDSSVFHVKKEKGGKFGFSYYSNVIDKNGVVNLHRYRIEWLRKAFAEHGIEGNATKSLDELSEFTDLLETYPESIRDYYEGIQIIFNDIKSNPDWKFFWEKCWEQVFSNTVAVIRNHKLSHEQLCQPLPLFLCGGGARMEYYRGLVNCFNSNHSRVWGHADQRPLTKPRALQVEGIRQDEYDRLAVAYGLSFLQLGSYARPLEIPDLPPPKDYEPKGEYIAKEFT